MHAEDPSGLSQIANALIVRPYSRRRRGKSGRPAIRHCCLFHNDPEPSADFYLDDGWYYCFGCGETYTVEEVTEQLGLGIPPVDLTLAEPATTPTETADETHKAQDRSPGLSMHADGRKADVHYNITLGQPIAVYEYKFPDGKLSHWKCRFEPKTFRMQAPDGGWKRPDPFWPIYGDFELPSELNLLLNESEKAVDVIAEQRETYQEASIAALTMGSAKDMMDGAAIKTLISRLKELAPRRILVWPDNDKAGQEWARPLYRLLSAQGFSVKLVDVRSLALSIGSERAQGPDDFIARGGSLEQVFIKEFQQAGGYTVDTLIEGTLVTPDGFLLMASRQILSYKEENVKVHYFRATGDATPQPKITQRLVTQLRSKSFDQPSRVFWRRWHDKSITQFYWRSQPLGFAYRINAGGISVAQDPPGAILLTSEDEPWISPLVNESGTRQDLESLCGFFGQNQSATIFIEAWLLCALLGLETPILLMRGEANSGKTIFSRLLSGILEPCVQDIDMPPASKSSIAERALKLGLIRNITAVLDNVSSMAYEFEDMLCRFVTGYSTLHSPLYEERVVNLSMRRGIIITTNNWSPAKGDLASRAVVLRTQPPSKMLPTEVVIQNFTTTVERIRGHLFKQAVFCYNRFPHIDPATPFRLAGLGKVILALGYDPVELSRQLSHTRAQLASESDAWYDVLLDYYHTIFDNEFRQGKTEEAKWEEMKGAVQGRTGYAPSDRELSRFINDSLPRFRDYGFSVKRKSNGQNRFWVFECLFAPQGDD